MPPDIGSQVYYIDLSNLENKPVKLEDFSNKLKESSKFQIGSTTKWTVYPTQIYVVDNLIYYTEHDKNSNSTLKSYNLNTEEIKTVINAVNWFSYTIDKINNKIFYALNGKLYIKNLDGTNMVKTGIDVTTSDFFTKQYYNNSVVLSTGSEQTEDFSWVTDLYKFNYVNNTMEILRENISSSYYITNNEILETKKSNIIYTCFVIK